ncbi:MAG: hypothetical protein P4L41_09495 [Flavipsychrobacter sp.]|nr:hypothetical protein [Flavipsychrobacter sp.]
MTTEIKEIEQQKINEAWVELCKLANQEIIKTDGVIDQDSFIKYGKQLFVVKFIEEAS